MMTLPQSESLTLLDLIIDTFMRIESQSSPSIPPKPSKHGILSLWFIGKNAYNECNLHVDAEKPHSMDYIREELTLCDWSLHKKIMTVTSGYGHNIYTVKSEREELLCSGFIRELERDLPFCIIPDPVYCLCFLYLEQLNQYWVAGSNANGQCGLGTVDRQIPLTRIEGISDILKVKSGSFGFSNLWIKYDGSLYINGCKHQDRATFLAIEGLNDLFFPNLSTFTQENPELRCVDGGSSSTFNVVIADNGSVWFDGDKLGHGRGDYIDGMSFISLDTPTDVHIVSVAVGEDFMLCLTQSGSVLSYGANHYGVLGLGQDLDNERWTLRRISFFDDHDIKIQSVCCGENHNLALSTDGKVYGWGDNGYGQCGVSDDVNVKNIYIHSPCVITPALIDVEIDVVVKRIECGGRHSGMITVDNEVYLWGSNHHNQCCGNKENDLVEWVFTPQNVTDYVLSESKKDDIVDMFLGWQTTLFLLE